MKSYPKLVALLLLCLAHTAAAAGKRNGARPGSDPSSTTRDLARKGYTRGSMGGKGGGGKQGGKQGGKTGGKKTGGKTGGKGGEQEGDDDPMMVMDPAPPASAPTEFPTVSRSRLNEVITCIAVIDESQGSQSLARFESLWTLFRESYPERPFCLLQPFPETPPSLFIPQAFLNDTDTIYSQVSRDFGVEIDRSDWFEVCSLDVLRAQGVVDFAIFIDNSGSLTTPQVQASFNLLLERAAQEGLTLVSGIENTAEDWISPFLTDFE